MDEEEVQRGDIPQHISLPPDNTTSPSGARSLISNVSSFNNCNTSSSRRRPNLQHTLLSQEGERSATTTSTTRTPVDVTGMIEQLTLEDREGGDGGDSDVEGAEVDIHGGAVEEEDLLQYDNVEESVLEEEEGRRLKGGGSGFLGITATGSTEVIGEIGEDGSIAIGGENNSYSHIDVSLPKPPPDYVPPPLKPDETPFENLDNPGNWNRYYFQPKRSKQNTYLGHFLPTGATPVPKNDEGKRMIGNWEFHYQGFSNSHPTYRRGATTSNLFPKEMGGQLDVEILKKLGLTKRRMTDCDALFFFQLLLPLCDPSKSGIDQDPRMAYYTDVCRFTNANAYLSGQGSDYGHVWNNTSACELLHFDGVLFHDGVLGGSNGALYRRWNKNIACCYSKDIATSMTLTRYGEIKRNLKLCNNDTAPKRSQQGYNPGYKYDLIYKAIVHNTNAITLKADETQVIDETTWGHSGYGESKTGITGRLRNKKVSKGGQTVLIMDRGRKRIRAYLHRSKIYNELFPESKRGWSANGPFEIKHLADQLLKMVDGNPDSSSKKIFRFKPTITADNYFQSDKIMNYLGERGLGAIMTSARNSLPKDVNSKYLHKEKTEAKNKYAKIARFAQPIVAVKNEATYQRIHVSFQSTSSCNISTVNALNEVSNFVELRERGRKDKKRYWVIEMNHARRIYLSTYNGVDVLDHLIKNTRLFYQTWRYWHSPKNHALSIAIACAYDIYRECCEGEIESEWKVESPVSSWDFQRILSIQALTYQPRNHHYPGDEKLRVSTVIPKSQRREVCRSTTAAKTHSSSSPLPSSASMTLSEGGRINRSTLKTLTEGPSTRGCGDLDKLCHHLTYAVRIKKGRICAYCGLKAYHACGICKGTDGKEIALHLSQKNTNGNVVSMCYFNWHNDNQIGLAKDDMTMLRKRKKSDWEMPTKKEKEENRKHIRELKERFR